MALKTGLHVDRIQNNEEETEETCSGGTVISQEEQGTHTDTLYGQLSDFDSLKLASLQLCRGNPNNVGRT